MIDISNAGTFTLGSRTVKRLGYGAMQLAGPGVFGPPKDHGAALAVLREAVANGVDHIDTSDFYGPHVTNIPAIESGWVKQIHSFGSEVGMDAYMSARSDIYFTGRDGSMSSN